jgi:hypothetical protein
MGQVGQTRPFPTELAGTYGSDSTIELLDFQTVYDDKQDVDNWVTQFNLYVNGQLVAQDAETKVNAPYRYGNLMIYQNSYDYRFLLEIAGAENEDYNTTYGLPDNQPLQVGEQTIVAAAVNGKPYVQISDHKNPSRGQFVEPGDVLVLDESGATVTYWDTTVYTVLELKLRYGTYIVFAGFLLATLASLLFFSGRYRELRILTGNRQATSQIWCYSKSAMVVEEMQETLAEQWKQQQEEQ